MCDDSGMSQDGQPSGPDIPVETDLSDSMPSVIISESDVIENVPIPESSHDLHSIDHLLALTSEGWDIDEQVRTIKRTVDDSKPRESALGITGEVRTPAVVMPTPFDLGAKAAPGTAPRRSPPPPAPDAGDSGPSPVPLGPIQPGSKPPPLPTAGGTPLRPPRQRARVRARRRSLRASRLVVPRTARARAPRRSPPRLQSPRFAPPAPPPSSRIARPNRSSPPPSSSCSRRASAHSRGPTIAWVSRACTWSSRLCTR
jgi:hypothetical protein